MRNLPLFAAIAGAAPLAALSVPCPVWAQTADAAVSASSARDTTAYTFSFSKPDARTVSVAGTFNNWNKDALPMVKTATGVWQAQTRVPFGKHQYKFVVNGDTWTLDPQAKAEPDGGGNTNSVLIIAPPDYGTPAKIGDGRVTASAVRHTASPPSVNYDRGKLSLSLRVRAGDVQGVSAIIYGKAGAKGERFPLVKQSEDELYATYGAAVPWNRKADLRYTFAVADGVKPLGFGATGFAPHPQPFVINASTFKPFVVPGWVERSVFYQIFPDRFANGDKTNDPKDVQPWNGSPAYFNRFGGDVAGVEQHLNHLSSLGVGAVYFNPVFQSPSNHRYDAEDFKKIDRDFGTNDEFVRLSKDLQKRGIRTVMDFVFNHTATTFFAFQDVRDKGAASAYKDWYFVKSYPVVVKDNPPYEAWYGFPSMPKLNVLNPPTHEYLLGLVDYWKGRLPLAGMRLDVASEVAPQFWRDLRVKAKTLDPDLWIVGEVWGDGSPWLKGDSWDSVMNYQFRGACIGFFAEQTTTPTQFMNRLVAIDKSYAPQVSRNMMNLLSSHDTPRFLTLCKNDADMHRLAALLQFTWVGAPSIYYGEEIGMQGGADPDNRRGMEWTKTTATNPMLTFYKKLIAVRNGSRALQSGDAHVLRADDASGTVAFSRTLGAETVVTVLNRSRDTQTVTVTAPAGRWRDALTGKTFAVGAGGKLAVSTAPVSGAVLMRVQ